MSASAITILKGLQLASVVLPELITLISHYRSLADSSEISDRDKQQIKNNLERLQLPDWDSI